MFLWRRVVELTWTLLAAATGPRYERRLWATDEGRSAAAALRRGERVPGRPLGPRQQAALLEADEAGAVANPDGLAAGPLSERHGGVGDRRARAAWPASARRSANGRDGRMAGRPAGIRGARPAGSGLTDAQADALRLVLAAVDGHDPTPILLDGVTGGGKTAIYVEAIAASPRGRSAGAAARAGDRARDADRRPPARGPPDPRRDPATRAWARASAPTSGAGSGPATRTSSSGRGRRCSRRSRTSAS